MLNMLTRQPLISMLMPGETHPKWQAAVHEHYNARAVQATLRSQPSLPVIRYVPDSTATDG